MNKISKSFLRRVLKSFEILDWNEFLKNWKRPAWDEFFMFTAIFSATRHTCLKRGVGAAIVKGIKIKSTGYCGAASGIDSCLDKGRCYYEEQAAKEVRENGGEFKEVRERFKNYCLAVHAEVNAASQCSREALKGGSLFITNYPCPKCAQDVIINNGIEKVVVWKEYLQDPSLTIDEQRASEKKFLEAGIKIKILDLKPERIMQIAMYMATDIGERSSYRYRFKKR